ncbi:MAG TPA: thioredoxin family protein [Planococcus sp. (in: firmicutes)]|nr:thioredoxin family protein [Planococcus sp. (in: firmicutes)]
MKKLESVEQFNDYKDAQDTIFMFTAGWCPDCRIIDPIMPDIEQAFPNYSFLSVDRDEFIDLCIELDIYGIPSFLAFSKGQELGRFVSRDRKTPEEIEAFIAGLQS